MVFWFRRKDKDSNGMAPNQIHVAVEREATLDELLIASMGPVVVRGYEGSGGTERLDHALAAGNPIYGVTTGFGALASHPADEDEHQHQVGLIHHLATGTGDALPARVVRGMIFDRLVTLSKGYSAASDALLTALATLLEIDAVPSIPRFGSVGASGDLTPLAHLALVLSGDGTFVGTTPERFRRFRFSRRDALALVNGTSTSNALASLALWDLGALIPVMVESMALMARSLRVPEAAYHETLHRLRGQPGQTAVAAALRHALSQTGGGATGSTDSHEQALQAAYSFRCIPQVLGPVVETVRSVAKTLQHELNAVTDNPVFDDSGTVLHGGNFHGQIVAEACDRLSFAAASAAGLLDRQIARITDPLLNHGLPPFLTGATAGGHSGLMGLQVSATALTAEINASAQRRYALESRSTNGANQDIVSMSTLAALAVYDTIPRLRELTAMHLIAATQAAEFAGVADESAPAAAVRRLSAPLREDRALSGEIVAIADALGLLTGASTATSARNSVDSRFLFREPMTATWGLLFPGISPPTHL